MRWFLAICAFFAIAAGQAYAVSNNNTVAYSPTSESIFGNLPLTHNYTLTVTCPRAVTQFPLTVQLAISANQPPVGDTVTALSYVSFSSSTLTFNSAGEQQSVSVTVTLPETALTANVPAGAYTYIIHTTGWPSGIVDSSSQINAQVSMPGATPGNPPQVAIASPNNYATYSYQADSFPQTVDYSFNATTDAGSPVITQVAAAFGTPTGMTPLAVATSGLGTAAVTGSGTITFPGPGTYKLSATATNSIGTASDEHTITVNVTVPPPTVTIASPSQTPPATYTYRAGDPALDVPFTFSGAITYGGIANLTASVDGLPQSFTATGLNSLTATATVHLMYDTAAAQGTHTLSVTATDASGQAVTTTGSFSINYVAPAPRVVIQSPTPTQTFVVSAGASTAAVPYQFTTTVTNGFVVDAVSASVSSSLLSPATTGMGTPMATSTGTMHLAPGTYQLVAVGGSAGQSDTQKVSFTVLSSAPPPTVVINSPADGYQAQIAPGTSATIPFQFTGTSHNPGSVITAMTATLDGVPVMFTCNTYNQPVAIGTASLTLNTTKTYHLVVTATDDAGTATTSSSFTLAPLPPHAVTGLVFFDVDGNGQYDSYDYGLAGIGVALRNASGVTIATTTTNAAGGYSFPGLYPALYTVSATPFAGLAATTPAQAATSMQPGADAIPAAIGFTLNLNALQGMVADGYSLGYWKNNVDKALAGRSGGVQVGAALIKQYTDALAQFALNPFDGLTEQQASSVMGSTSANAADLLAKQLLPAEYNYQNGAYLNGNAVLTYAFVYWGEWVLSHSSLFSSAYVLTAQDWFDAYNNTHGGVLAGPATSSSHPTSADTSGGSSGSSGGCTGTSDSPRTSPHATDSDSASPHARSHGSNDPRGGHSGGDGESQDDGSGHPNGRHD